MLFDLKTRLAIAWEKFTEVGSGMLVKHLTSGEMVLFPVGKVAKRVMRIHFPKSQRRFLDGYVLGQDWKSDYDAVHHHPDFPGPAVWI